MASVEKLLAVFATCKRCADLSCHSDFGVHRFEERIRVNDHPHDRRERSPAQGCQLQEHIRLIARNCPGCGTWLRSFAGMWPGYVIASLAQASRVLIERISGSMPPISPDGRPANRSPLRFVLAGFFGAMSQLKESLDLRR